MSAIHKAKVDSFRARTMAITRQRMIDNDIDGAKRLVTLVMQWDFAALKEGVYQANKTISRGT